MITGLQEIYVVASYSIDEAMLLGEPAGPTTRQQIFERFGLSYSSEGLAQDVLDEFERAHCDFAVVFDPVTKVFPKPGRKDCLPLTWCQGLFPDGTVRLIAAYPCQPWRGGERTKVVVRS